MYANVKSTSGKIDFDANSDSAVEMSLNQSGLGIGMAATSNLSVLGNALVTDQINIGSTTANSNLNVAGSVAYAPVVVSGDMTLADAHTYLINSSTGNLRLTLPYAGNVTGRTYHLKKISRDNAVVVNGGGNLIDDAQSIELKNYNSLGYPSLSITSAEGQWWKIHSSYNYDLIAADNLIRWYKLDETSGTHTNDSSGNEVPGVLLGGFDFSTSTISGKINNALNFDATDNRAELDDLDLPANQKFSISLWINTTGSQLGNSGIGYLVSKDQYHGNSPYNMTVTSSNTFSCVVSGDAATSLSTVNDGQWHHCVMVIDGTTMSNYLDGQFQDSDTVVHDQNNDENFAIGSSDINPSYRPFSGNIDDVRVYDIALSASEISKIYEAASGQ